MGWHRKQGRRRWMGLCAWSAFTAPLLLALAGCTVYPVQTSPNVSQTTSAEQADRLFWQDVQKGNWIAANALLAPNAVWRVNGTVIERTRIIPWLQSLGIHGAQVADVALTPAVNDMTVVSTLQIQADKRVAAQPGTVSAGSSLQTLHALAVWQEPQPTGKKQKDKQYRGYLLTVHDLTTAGHDGCP